MARACNLWKDLNQRLTKRMLRTLEESFPFGLPISFHGNCHQTI